MRNEGIWSPERRGAHTLLIAYCFKPYEKFQPDFGFILCVSKGRPLVWWYGGVKAALRIDSRDASDFAKKLDLNI